MWHRLVFRLNEWKVSNAKSDNKACRIFALKRMSVSSYRQRQPDDLIMQTWHRSVYNKMYAIPKGIFPNVLLHILL